ncbi:MAG: hypothetical protein JWP94_3097 [Mucilaginibacter sp.]|nr:hypothetical protein [Mucilaginibacter sp.]
MINKRYIILYKVYAFILLAIVFTTGSCKKPKSPIIPTTPEPPVTYRLVWSDEFNGIEVDQTFWNINTGNPSTRNEQEYYQSANAVVTNGSLLITAKKEAVAGYKYTSALINSMGKVNGTYGRVEARIKMPLAQGLWPAFWCLGANFNTVGWPACGEIDIMEHVNTENTIRANIHWLIDKAVVNGTSIISTPDEYHLYAIEWDTNSIKWSLDNKLYFTQDIANNFNSTGAFHLPFFIVLSMAVAGDLPGQAVDESKLPATMYVDYVRVYVAQ